MAIDEVWPVASERRPTARKWLIGAGIAGAVVAAVAWAFDPLRGLPDVGEPRGVDAFRELNIADEDNAFVLYRRATARHVSWRQPSEVNDWASADPARRQWLAQNGEALAFFVEGSSRPDAMYIRPQSLRIDTLLPVTQALRDLSRLALLEASRLRAEGEPAAAWAYYRAVLRASRHTGTNGCGIERVVGAAMWNAATPEIERWSADPRVDAAVLRGALADVEEAEALTAPVGDRAIAEYLMLVQTIEDPKFAASPATFMTNFGLPGPPVLKIGNWTFSWDMVRSSGPALWLRGEPERTKRLLRLIFANWLEYCDRRPADWPERVDVGGFRLFVPETNAPETLRRMSLQELGHRATSSIVAPLLVEDLFDPLLEATPGGGGPSSGMEKEEENRRRLREVLQAQIEARAGARAVSP